MFTLFFTNVYIFYVFFRESLIGTLSSCGGTNNLQVRKVAFILINEKKSASGTYCVENLIGTMTSCGGAPKSQVRQVAL